MGIPDGAHTHGSGGGGGLGMAVLVIVAAGLLGPAVAAAVAELLHLLVIVAVVLAAVAGAGAVALLAFRGSRGRQETARCCTPGHPRTAPAVSAALRAGASDRGAAAGASSLPRHRPGRDRRHHPRIFRKRTTTRHRLGADLSSDSGGRLGVTYPAGFIGTSTA